MKSLPFPKWYRDISIAHKLYFAVGIMALLIAVELFTLWFSVNTLSSVRAFVSGEGLWSKAQKDAIYNLRKYAQSGKEEDYREFLSFLKVPLGDRKTRMEMAKKNPDPDIMRQGFLEGRNHADDVDGMIKLFSRFHTVPYIRKAITIWTEGDSLIFALQESAEKLHSIVLASGTSSPEKTTPFLNEIDEINKKITLIEDGFSSTLGEGSRWLEGLILKILLAVALTVELMGIFLGISVSLTITRGIREIIRVAAKISRGSFSERAAVFSKDEIGVLSNSFNEMIDKLEENIVAIKEAQQIIQQKSEELARSNQELEQFAYVASHDLQEPLRMVSSFLQLLTKRMDGKLDDDSKEYIHFAVDGSNRMRNLINSLLEYSRVNRVKPYEWFDTDNMLDNVLQDLSEHIQNNDVIVKRDKLLPAIYGDAVLIGLLFQNMIGNAIKFRGKENPEIKISASDEPLHWQFSVSDNGIGIEKRYYEKIFIIFQRLNTREEFAGTGIGLAICKKIVERHGGKIWLESEPGKGTTFYFTIFKSVNKPYDSVQKLETQN